MSHVKNLLYVSQSWEEKNLDSAAVRMFLGQLMAAARGAGKPQLGRPRRSDSWRKVLAFNKFAISFSKPLGLLLPPLQGCQMCVWHLIWPDNRGFSFFLTTSSSFGPLTFYAFPKWEPQVKKKDLNYTESWTTNNLHCPETTAKPCRENPQCADPSRVSSKVYFDTVHMQINES